MQIIRKKRRRMSGFDIGVTVMLAMALVIIIYPLYFTIIASVSDPVATARGRVFLFPVGFTFEAYHNVIENQSIWTGYRNTIIYTVFGTCFNLFLTIPAAYALSKRELPCGKALVWVFMFTMYFSGGMIPTYLVVKQLGLINTWYALIMLGGVNIFNLVVTRNYYQTTIPRELFEAAAVDGCQDAGAFFRIALPLSGSIIAVMTLFYGVGHWNDFFNGLIYLSREKYYPLQLILRGILLQSQNAIENLGTSATDEEVLDAMRRVMLAESMKYAVIFIASFPVMIAYVFVQKYFVKGVMLGAVKG